MQFPLRHTITTCYVSSFRRLIDINLTGSSSISQAVGKAMMAAEKPGSSARSQEIQVQTRTFLPRHMTIIRFADLSISIGPVHHQRAPASNAPIRAMTATIRAVSRRRHLSTNHSHTKAKPALDNLPSCFSRRPRRFPRRP